MFIMFHTLLCLHATFYMLYTINHEMLPVRTSNAPRECLILTMKYLYKKKNLIAYIRIRKWTNQNFTVKFKIIRCPIIMTEILIDWRESRRPIRSFSNIFLNVQYFDSPYYSIFAETFPVRVSVDNIRCFSKNIAQINIMLNNESPDQYAYMTT